MIEIVTSKGTERVYGVEVAQSESSGLSQLDFILTVCGQLATSQSYDEQYFLGYTSAGKYYYLAYVKGVDYVLKLNYVYLSSREYGFLVTPLFTGRSTVSSFGLLENTVDEPYRIPDSTKVASYKSFSFQSSNFSYYFNCDFAEIHPAFSDWSKETTIHEPRTKPKNIFNFTNYNDELTGVIVYKNVSNGNRFFRFLLNNNKPVIDYTRDVLDFGGSRYYYNMNNSIGTVDSAKQIDSYSKISASLTLSTGETTVAFSTAIGTLDNIYYNSEDIYDENGNLLLEKNCELSDFI